MNKLGVALIALIFSSGAFAVKITFTSEEHEVAIESLGHTFNHSEAGTSEDNAATPFTTIKPNTTSGSYDLKDFMDLVLRYKINNIYQGIDLTDYSEYEKITVNFLSDGSHAVTTCNKGEGCTTVIGFNLLLRSRAGIELVFPHANNELKTRLASAITAFDNKDKKVVGA